MNEFNEIKEKGINVLNTLIENKKLQINYIWSNKINQIDPGIIKSIDDNQKNLILIKNIFNNLIKFTKIINDIFQFIHENEMQNFKLDDNYNNKLSDLAFFLASLLHKIRNFLEIKIKSFKISKGMIEPIVILINYFKLFNNLKNNSLISIKLLEISDSIQNFYEIIALENNLN